MNFKQEKQSTIDLLFLGLVFVLAFGVKYYYANCGVGDLKLFLKPVSVLIAFFTGSSYQYNPEVGYFFPALNIVIERSCSGVNFFVMAFCMVAISTLPFYRSIRKKALALLSWTVFAFILTITATSSRIIIAISSLHLQDLLPFLGGDKMHMAQGSFVYLFFLILFYFLVLFSNKKISQTYA